VPASITARAGGCVPVTVYALRKDGFTNEIYLALKDAPAGFVLGGARIPAHADRVRVTLSAPAAPSPEPISIRLEGFATIDGRSVTHPAIPAEDMMQAFAYRHLVAARELDVATGGRRGGKAARLVSERLVSIPAGGIAHVPITAPGLALLDRIHLELSDAPDGITIKNINPSREGVDLVLQSDAAKTKVGLEGNLIVNAYAERNGPPKGSAKQNKVRAPLGTLPAISFHVVAR